MRILLVEDDADLRDYLIRTFERENHEVFAADTAEKAIQMVASRQGELHLVLCDYQLPGADGMAVLSHLQQINASVPFVLMTAHGDLKSAVKALCDGAFEFLVKPFPRQSLRHLFERIPLAQAAIESPYTTGRSEGEIAMAIPATRAAVNIAVSQIFHHFSKALTDLGKPPRLFESAVYQAVMNALTHGSSSESDAIRIRATLDKFAFTVEVEDSGTGFAHQHHSAEKVTTLPSLEGKGIPIIMSAFPEVNWNAAGNVIVMRQTLQTSPPPIPGHLIG